MKDGVEYFPLDVSLDEKFELIEAEFGLTGFAVVIKLYQKIYQHGCYCEWTNEVALLFSHRIGLGGNAVSEIVNASVRRGIFDKSMFEKYHILTSRGIQERYFGAVIRRKNASNNSQRKGKERREKKRRAGRVKKKSARMRLSRHSKNTAVLL